MFCIECSRGFHDECGNIVATDQESYDSSPCCCARPTGQLSVSIFSEALPLIEEIRKVGRPPKPDEEISESAGRKRAAELYNPEMGDDKLCEWLGLSNCGGGFAPIIGCLRGRRTDIHHGPDKHTYNNDRRNISLICSLCHNRWHATNDPLYGKDKCPDNIKAKEPRPQTKEEFLQAIANESNRK